MAMKFRVEIIRKEIIKPSSPTPLSLKNFKLSLLDQLTPPMYVPVILCYTNDTEATTTADCFAEAEARSQLLKKSLSETLTRFYPFAGRISGDSLIECNDEGVDFIETRIDCLLQEILKQPERESLRKLLPLQTGSTEVARGQLLVQLNFFKCGGMVIGLNHSHKIMDFVTFNLFIKTWAAVSSKGSYEVVVSPDFETNLSLFPPLNSPPGMKTDWKGKKVVSRRLVFNASSISMLKAEAANADVLRPTRVEAVMALIWQCARAAATSNRGGLKKPSLLLQAVNLRKVMEPPIPENSMGNLSYAMTVHSSDYETDQLHSLVKQFRSGIRGFRENFIRKFQGSDAASTIFQNSKEVGNYLSREDDIDFYIGNSLCRFEVYESDDFGWGKPRWVCHNNMTAPQIGFLLIDTRDGEGIEAWVNLSEADMTFFERNQQLLAFASVNPISKR